MEKKDEVKAHDDRRKNQDDTGEEGKNVDGGAKKKGEKQSETKKDVTKKDETKKGGKKGPLRDQSKSKKFTEFWQKLPESVRSHFNGLSRSDQTNFIHSGVTRERGKLIVNEQQMLNLMTQRQETQSGKEKMKGYALEDFRGPQNTHTQTHLPNLS